MMRFLKNVPSRSSYIPFPIQVILRYIRLIQVKGYTESFHKSDLVSPIRLDQNSYLHHFGIFTHSPITISSSLLFSHIISEDFISPKPFNDKVLNLKNHVFQINSSTPSSDLLTGAFSKFGVLSLPLSSVFNRLSSKEGHLWTPQIFQNLLKIPFLPLNSFFWANESF